MKSVKNTCGHILIGNLVDTYTFSLSWICVKKLDSSNAMSALILQPDLVLLLIVGNKDIDTIKVPKYVHTLLLSLH